MCFDVNSGYNSCVSLATLIPFSNHSNPLRLQVQQLRASLRTAEEQARKVSNIHKTLPMCSLCTLPIRDGSPSPLPLPFSLSLTPPLFHSHRQRNCRDRPWQHPPPPSHNNHNNSSNSSYTHPHPSCPHPGQSRAPTPHPPRRSTRRAGAHRSRWRWVRAVAHRMSISRLPPNLQR